MDVGTETPAQQHARVQSITSDTLVDIGNAEHEKPATDSISESPENERGSDDQESSPEASKSAKETEVMGMKVIISREVWAVKIRRFFKRLFHPPKLRQDWGDEQESKVDWFELFYDLVYVGMLIRLGNFFKESSDTSGTLISLVFYLNFFQTWLTVVTLKTRISSTDGFGVWMMTIHSMGVIGMAVNMEHGLDEHTGFGISAVVSRLPVMCVYLQVDRFLPRAQWVARCWIGAMAASCAFFIGGAVTSNNDAAAALFLVGIFVENMGNQVSWLHPKKRLPINVEHFSERLALLVMLFLGEGIISLITPPLVQDAAHYRVVMVGFIVLMCCKHLYYGAQPVNIALHAMRHSQSSGRTFFFAHIPLGAALVGLGVGMKRMLSHTEDEKRSDDVLVAECLFVFLLVNNIIRLSHPFRKRYLVVWVLRVLIQVLVGILPTIAKSSFGVLVGCAVSTISLVLVDMIMAEREKQNAPEQSFEVDMGSLQSMEAASPVSAPAATDTALLKHPELKTAAVAVAAADALTIKSESPPAERTEKDSIAAVATDTEARAVVRTDTGVVKRPAPFKRSQTMRPPGKWNKKNMVEFFV